MQTENRNPNYTAGHGRQTPKQIPKETRPQSASTSRNTSRLGSTSSRKTSTPTTSKQSSVDWDVSAIQDKNTPTHRIKPVATTARKPTARGTESEMKPRLIVPGLKQQNAKLAINPSAKKSLVNASSKKPSAMKALPRTGATSSPGEADAEINLEIEYCRYLQAEVMRANSEQNLELMRAEIQKQVLQIWNALEAQRIEVLESEERNIELKFLHTYHQQLKAFHEKMKILLQHLPETTNDLQHLSEELTVSLNHLHVVGTETMEGHVQDLCEQMQRATSDIKAASNPKASETLQEFADQAAKVQTSLQKTLHSFDLCWEKLRAVKSLSAREASLKLSTSEHIPETIELEIPVQIEEKLIDI